MVRLSIRYVLRMPRPRNVAKILLVASAVVVAASVATLTVRVMTTGFPVHVQHETTRDASYFTPQVLDELRGRGILGEGLTSVSCPSDEKVKTGMTFRCEVQTDLGERTVQVTVLDADTGEIEVGEPS